MNTFPHQIRWQYDGSPDCRETRNSRLLRGVAQQFRIIISFEMTFLLFVFAGIYKSDPRFAWFPIDWTLLFLGINVLQAGWIVTRRGFHLSQRGTKLVVVVTLFVGYAAFSLLWSEGTIYARQKTLHMVVLVLWSLAGSALIVSHGPERLHCFLRLLLIFAAWVVLESARYYVQHPSARLITALGGPGSYLGLGRVVGLGTLIAFYKFAFVARRPAARTLTGGMLLAGLVMGILIGSRGPLIATAISLVPLIGLALSRKNRNRSRGLIAVGLIGASLIGIAGVQWHLVAKGRLPGTLARLTRLGNETIRHGGSLTRWDYLVESARLWSQRPMFGNGIGSFPVLVNGTDARDYPHNLIAEVASELGVCGLILLAGMFLVAVKRPRTREGWGGSKFGMGNGEFGTRVAGRWPHSEFPIPNCNGRESSTRNPPGPSHWSDPATHLVWNRSLRLLILMLLLHTLLNALISGDIPANRTLFAMLGLSAMNTDRP